MPLTPFPGDLKLDSGCLGHCIPMVCSHRFRQYTYLHIRLHYLKTTKQSHVLVWSPNWPRAQGLLRHNHYTIKQSLQNWNRAFNIWSPLVERYFVVLGIELGTLPILDKNTSAQVFSWPRPIYSWVINTAAFLFFFRGIRVLRLCRPSLSSTGITGACHQCSTSTGPFLSLLSPGLASNFPYSFSSWSGWHCKVPSCQRVYCIYTAIGVSGVRAPFCP